MRKDFKALLAFGVAGVLSASILAFADISQKKSQYDNNTAVPHTTPDYSTEAAQSTPRSPILAGASEHRIKPVLPTPEPTPQPTPEPPVRKPNEIGDIMIIMYHGVLDHEPKEDYMTTIDAFNSDLQTMYDQGYRLVSISDLMDNNINVPAGYTPIVITFDDGEPTAFSLTRQPDGTLAPRENSGVDLINKFNEKYPDFGRGGVFFINGWGREPFYGDGEYADRFKYLIDNGYEIGNHTYSHADLKKSDGAKIQQEMAKLERIVQNDLPGFRIRCMAYPYGNRPNPELRGFALRGSYDGIEYNYDWGLKEGRNGLSAAPNHRDYDPFNIPRVRGTDNAVTDLGWCFRYYQENPGERYVSDGDPDVISVPSDLSEYVNMESLGDKELNLYNPDDHE